MKRIFYIFLFTCLGLLLQQIAHALIEMGYIALLLRDWSTWSFGLSYETLLLVHHVCSVLLLALGVWLGYKGGVHFWQKIYGQKA